MTNTPLRAMFWKECRENLRWAVLAMLALTLGLIYAWYHLFQQNSFPSPSGVWTSENLVLTISMPLIGLTLGLLQILPELRRDQWAFLVHRPASRTTLFFGKVLPGVCLYLLATILPLLGLAAWASQPIHVPAPFDFRFTLAGWAAILAGLPFYFAGLLVALRPARWYGSRALPVLTAILAPLAASTFNLFWPVVLVSVFISAVLLCAAWGSFVTSGEYKAQAKPARFALGLALYPACVCVGIGALMLSFTAYFALTHSGNGEGWRNKQMIDTQGHIYEHDEHFDKRGHDTITVTDENGRNVDPHVWDNLSSSHKLLTLNNLYSGGLGQFYFRYSDADHYVPSLASIVNDRDQTFWYYDLAAYQMVRYKITAEAGEQTSSWQPPVVNYLGPDGFGSNRKQVGKFEDPKAEAVDFADFHLLRVSNALYSYDPTASVPAIRELQSLSGSYAGATSLAQTSQGLVDTGNGTYAEVLIVTSNNQVTAYTSVRDKVSQMPSRLFTVSIPFMPETYSDVQVAASSDYSRFFFLYQPRSMPAAERLVTVTSTGQIVSDQILPPAKDNHSAYKMRFIDAAPALMLPPGGLCAAALYGYIGDRLHWGSASGLWPSITETAGPILFFSILGGLAAAVLTWLISRRCGDNRRGHIAWALGGFWLGGYGVLLLLALRAWPARLPCPDCGRPRVVDNDFCEHCRAGWTRPQQDGTEIFDADSREAAAR